MRVLTGSASLWGYWNALIETLSLQSQAGRAPRVPLGRQQEQLRRAVAVAHCEQGAPLSAGRLGAFFLFVFLRCGSGSFPLAAPASSGCVPPAAKGKSRISRAHCGKGRPERLGAKPETENTLRTGSSLTQQPTQRCSRETRPRLRQVTGKGDVHSLAYRPWC